MMDWSWFLLMLTACALYGYLSSHALLYAYTRQVPLRATIPLSLVVTAFSIVMAVQTISCFLGAYNG